MQKTTRKRHKPAGCNSQMQKCLAESIHTAQLHDGASNGIITHISKKMRFIRSPRHNAYRQLVNIAHDYFCVVYTLYAVQPLQ